MMEVKYYDNVVPNLFGILSKDSTLEIQYVYAYSTDKDWADRMSSYGEKVIEGTIKKSFYVDRLSFDNIDDAIDEVRRNMLNAENSKITIEVVTEFLAKSEGLSDFTHMEQLKR